MEALGCTPKRVLASGVQSMMASGCIGGNTKTSQNEVWEALPHCYFRSLKGNSSRLSSLWARGYARWKARTDNGLTLLLGLRVRSNKGASQCEPRFIRGPKDHMNMWILQKTVVSGIPLCLGP